MPKHDASWIAAIGAAQRFSEATLSTETMAELLAAARRYGEPGIDGGLVPDPTNPDVTAVVTLDETGVMRTRHVVATDLEAELAESGIHRVALDADEPALGALLRTTSAPESDVLRALMELCAATIRRIGDGGRSRLAANAAMALRHVADGVILVGSDQVVRVWTAATSRILGIPERQAVGRLIHEVLEDWPRLQGYINTVRKDELGVEVRADPVPLAVPSGERWVAVRGVDVGDGSVVFTVRDASEERLRDQQLLDYVATASHQLRTPVAAINGAALTLLRDDIDFSDEQRDQFLQMIADGSDRLVQTVDAVINASRVQGASNLRRNEPVEMRAFIEQVVAPIATGEGHTVVVDIPEQLRVVVDRTALDVAVSNIVENAIKYSPAGGEVRIGASRRSDRVLVTVRDEGLGISEAELPRIFDKFYRADPDMREGIGGTGLGLYITAEMVDRAGGSLSVNSVQGAGTTFTIELPATGMAKADQVQRFQRGVQDRSREKLRADDSVARLIAAIGDFNARSAHEEISHLFARYGRSVVLRDALVPLLRTVGGRGEPTSDSIAREHFISNIIRGRIWSLTRDWQRPGRPQVLLACAPEEQHDLGLLMFGVALHELGWSVTWLGTRTPVSSIAHVVDELDPACVVMAALAPSALPRAQETELEQLARRVPIFVGGSAAWDVQSRVDGVMVLEGDPTDAAFERWFVEAVMRLQATTTE